MAWSMDKTGSQLLDASRSWISENDHHWIMAANSLALYVGPVLDYMSMDVDGIVVVAEGTATCNPQRQLQGQASTD